MSLDIFQQIFSLSLITNSVNSKEGGQSSLQQSFQQTLVSRFPTIDAGWELVWGPVVIKSEPENAKTGPQNSWYIAFHPHLRFEDGSVHPTYVIAIAGTPRRALHVWLNQNFAVNHVTDFKAWVAGGIHHRPKTVPRAAVTQDVAYIAQGTVETVHLLLTTPAPHRAKSEGSTLLDFITHTDRSASTRFIFTGYSLGGALAPSLALALVSAGHIDTECTLTYPIAGPTPGNIDFTKIFVKHFPPRPCHWRGTYHGWNLNLVNRFDLVPQAWCTSKHISTAQNLNNIFHIYNAPMPISLRSLVHVAILWSARSCVLYKPLPGQYFHSFCPKRPRFAPFLYRFLNSIPWQHYQAYFLEVGVPCLEG